jgi:hypothetical protein
MQNTGKSPEKFLWAVAMAGMAAGTFFTGLALSALHISPIKVELSAPATDMVTLVASLLGAIVGGGVSIAGTFLFQRHERYLADRARAFSILTKASSMYSEMANIWDHISQCVIESRHDIGRGAPLWTVLMPQSWTYVPKAFEATEVSVLMEKGLFDLHADITRLEMNHATICQGWSNYTALRRDIRGLMPVEEVEGSKITSEIDPRKNPEAAIRVVEMTALIDSLVQLTPRLLEETKVIAESLGPAFRQILKDPKFPKIKLMVRQDPI